MSTLVIASPIWHRPALRRRLRGHRGLQRARTGVLHMLELGRDDDAVMVTAAARQNAQQLVRRSIDDGDPARQPLKAAERRENVFAVIGYGRSLQAGADTLEFLFHRPGLGTPHHDA